jgi:hypothetical protein
VIEARQAERGEVDAVLLLGASLMLGLYLITLLQQIADRSQEAYQALDDRSQELPLEVESFQAWGQDWLSLPPRIDYGAYHLREKDAEAICYYLDFMDGPKPGAAWRCESAGDSFPP